MTRKHGKERANCEDETRYCENCGISFIWTAEEQRAPLSSPADQPSVAQGANGAEGRDVSILVQHPQSAIDERQVAPLYCPGCRQLLPEQGKERGLVKWYHRRKGYGFIVRVGEPDIYVHRSALRQGYLTPDDLVEFTLGENRQGTAAVSVHMLDKAADQE